MEYVDTFCEKYCKYIERQSRIFQNIYPEYKSSQYFGNCLDAKWLSYNFALILLKLLHLADLEKKYNHNLLKYIKSLKKIIDVFYE